MKKKLLLFLLCFFAVWQAKADVALGSGTTEQGYTPIFPWYKHSYTQQIFLASDIAASGTITGLKFYAGSSRTLSNTANWTVYLAHVTRSSFSSTTDWEPLTNLTQVFTGAVTKSGTEVSMTFDNPFVYNGTDNLVVAVYESNTTGNDGNWNFYGTTGRSNMTLYKYADSSGPTPAIPLTGDRSAIFSNITFVGITQPCPVTFTGVTAANITTSSADISFTPSATAPTYEYYYSTSMTPPTASTTISGTTSTTTASLSGLQSSKDYYFWVRAACTVVDKSNWSAINAFATSCAPIATFPYTENFDASSNLPACWSTAHTEGSATAVFSTSTTYAHSGTRSAYISYLSAGNKTNLVSPQLNIPTANTHMVKFWMYRFSGTSYNGEVVKVWVNATPDTIGGILLTNNKGTTYINKYTGNAPVETANVAGWYEYTADITTAGVQYVIFELTSKNGSGTFIDDVSFEVLPSCPKPTVQNVSDITSTGATLSWSGSASSYEYFYSTNNTVPDASTTATGTIGSNSVVLTGLTPTSTHTFYVRAVCGAEKSEWSNVITFNTLCPIYATPFVEDFNGEAFPSDCWARYSGDFTDGKLTSALTTSTTWSSSTTGMGGSKHASLTYGTYYSSTYWLVTPAIEIENNTKELTFDFALTNSSGTVITPSSYAQFRVAVSIDGGLSWQTANSTLWNNTGISTISGTEVIVPLSTYAGQTVKIAFIANLTSSSSTTSYYFKIDNVKVKEMPACPKPIDLVVSDVTSTGASLSWTGTSANYDYYYSTTATAPDATTTPNGQVATASATLTGLAPVTTYYVWVRSACGADGVSDWSLVKSFTTACAAYPLPFAENFNAVDFPAACWTRFSGLYTDGILTSALTTSTSGWIAMENPFILSGSKHTKLNIYGNNKYWLVSPEISIDAVGKQLTFDVVLTAYLSTSATTAPNAAVLTGVDDVFKVIISTDAGMSWHETNATTWDNAGSSKVYNSLASAQVVAIDLSAYAGQTIKVAFYGESTVTNADNDLHIDNVLISDIPACPIPSGVSMSALRPTTATMSWDGTASSYDYYLSSSATAPDGSTTPTEAGLTAATKALTGLSPLTTYYFWVRANCGSDGISGWSAVSSFTTLCPVEVTPFVEDFEGTTFPSNCWGRYSGTFTDGAAASLTATTSGWASSTTTAGIITTKHAAVSLSSTNYWLTTPEIEIVDANKQLSFDFAITSSTGAALSTIVSYTRFNVAVSEDNGATWHLLRGWDNTNIAAVSGSKIELNLAAYSGKTIKIAFIGFYTAYSSTTSYVRIDNVLVSDLPACPKPLNIIVSNVSDVSATLSWTGTAANYDYFLATSSVAPDASTVATATVGTSSVTLTSLTESTTYYFWVRSNCLPGDGLSDWSLSTTFKTSCSPIALPFSEGFESTSGTALPSCWSSQHTAGSATGLWVTTTTNPNTGTRAVSSAYQAAGNKVNLVTPLMTVPSPNNYQVRFSMRRNPYGDTYVGEGIKLWVNTTPDTIGATPLVTNRGTSFISANYTLTPAEAASGYYEYTAAIPTGGNVYIVFETIWKSGYAIYMDDFYFEEIPACQKPTGLSFDNITPTSAEATIVDAVGSAWQFAVGTTGFTPDESNVIATTTLVTTIPGLIAGNVYDVYVRTDCSASADGFSEWFGPVALETGCYDVTVSASETASVCAGSDVTLAATSDGSYTYSWSEGTTVVGTTASIVVAPTVTTNYILTATLANCVVSRAITVAVVPAPGVVTIPTPAAAAAQTPIELAASVANYTAEVVALQEGFNGTIDQWTLVNNSTGGTAAANSSWMLKPDGHTLGSYVFHSNDNSQFIISNSDAGGLSSHTITELISPLFSLPADATTATLSFYQYYRYVLGVDTARVQISSDGGSTWANLATYTAAVGSVASFNHTTIDLISYVGMSNLKIRFKYVADNKWYWALDNVKVSAEVPVAPAITWSPVTNLFLDEEGTTPYVAGNVAATVYAIFPTEGSTTYTATATIPNGCTSEASVTATAGPTVNNDQYTTQNVVLYPNPVTTQLFIQSEATVKSVSVFSATGAKLMEVSGNVSTIDVQSLVQGMYIVQINLIDGNSVKQTIIKR